MVVTIVVLIILATISINLAYKENGIIKKAKYSKELYGNSVVAEEESMNKLLAEFANAIAEEEDDEDEGSGEENTKSISASVVAAAPATYYGKTITGYTGYEKESSGYNWQIYYSDGNNIYITTTDYILTTDCPNGRGDTAPDSSGYYQPYWYNIVSDYDGSSDITDTKLTSWLSYLSSDYGTNDYNNMKATAYLLDTSVWNTNFKGDNADYAIGGPTLDMFMASYKDTHEDKYVELDPDTYGYQVKWSTESGYATDISGLTADEFNGLYIKYDTSKAFYQWVASPSAYDDNNMLVLGFAGVLTYGIYSDDYGYAGVRPIVCLSSDVVIEASGNGYAIK